MQVTQGFQLKTFSIKELKRFIWERCGRGFLMHRLLCLKGFQISTRPHFDSIETTDWFIEQLKQTQRYVEFGTGGSTYLAAELEKEFVGIDPDKYFLDDVKKKITSARLFNADKQTYIYADIGLTYEWSKPFIFLFFYPSKARLKKFAAYSDFPVQDKKDVKTLVLVDGRFRVACALKSIRSLKDSSDWTLVVDDYTGRPNYAVIEKFAVLERLVGRMAVFKSKPDLDAADLCKAIEKYQWDWE